MNKIIITRREGQILTALISGQRAVQLNLEEEDQSILGNIYIGKVKNIAKNINSAFVDLGGGLTAYYSLAENRNHLFTDSLGRGNVPEKTMDSVPTSGAEGGGTAVSVPALGAENGKTAVSSVPTPGAETEETAVSFPTLGTETRKTAVSSVPTPGTEAGKNVVSILPPSIETGKIPVSVPMPDIEGGKIPVSVPTPGAETGETAISVPVLGAETRKIVVSISPPDAEAEKTVVSIPPPNAETGKTPVSVPIPGTEAGKTAASIPVLNAETGNPPLTSPDSAHKPENPQSVPRRLRPGDEIVVQVSKDAIKTKDPVVTSCISLTGRYCVITAGRCHIGFSSKISDEKWKSEVRQALLAEKDRDFGIIVRTNAAFVTAEEILKELKQLKNRYYGLLSEAAYRTCRTLLYRAEPSYIGSLRDTYRDFMEEVVTDDADIFRSIQEYLKVYQPQDLDKVRFYQDPLLSLGKLYSLDRAIDEATQKRVWLKSGGYLVIEPTEAMTVIDVNSGKYAGKKTQRDTILKINLEAAREIAFQLRLRNLSGIIVIDFIDMDFQEDKEELMKVLISCCMKDPVKTTVVDMTKLGLVEVTRKKIRKPFREQMQKGDKTR